MQYGTTSDFLRCFGLKSIEDLPSASEELMNMFEKTREKEESEREVDENQISISDLEAENQEQNANSVDTPTDESNDGESDGETPVIEAEDPSADDDIVDVD
jgi:hypothetical protein